jgi:rare lipoprotein A
MRPARALALGAIVLSLGFVWGCGPKRAPEPAPVRRGWTEEGIASWYGKPFHGRKTASGERYDMHELTAAHPTLPFGTRVRVKRLDNGRDVVVRITDRGPFHEGRIIDLSKRAAREIGLLEPGTARVRIEVIRTAS